MKTEKVYKVNILGAEGEISVINDKEGRYMCMFDNKTKKFVTDYNAYGFLVWTEGAANIREVYYPIARGEETKLTTEIMHNTWMQIKDNDRIAW